MLEEEKIILNLIKKYIPSADLHSSSSILLETSDPWNRYEILYSGPEAVFYHTDNYFNIKGKCLSTTSDNNKHDAVVVFKFLKNEKNAEILKRDYENLVYMEEMNVPNIQHLITAGSGFFICEWRGEPLSYHRVTIGREMKPLSIENTLYTVQQLINILKTGRGELPLKNNVLMYKVHDDDNDFQLCVDCCGQPLLKDTLGGELCSIMYFLLTGKVRGKSNEIYQLLFDEEIGSLMDRLNTCKDEDISFFNLQNKLKKLYDKYHKLNNDPPEERLENIKKNDEIELNLHSEPYRILSDTAVVAEGLNKLTNRPCTIIVTDSNDELLIKDGFYDMSLEMALKFMRPTLLEKTKLIKGIFDLERKKFGDGRERASCPSTRTDAYLIKNFGKTDMSIVNVNLDRTDHNTADHFYEIIYKIIMCDVHVGIDEKEIETRQMFIKKLKSAGNYSEFVTTLNRIVNVLETQIKIDQVFDKV